MGKTREELTAKQRRFVEEYVVDWNATQAAIRAGYASSGARTEGARLLANADIAAAVGARMRELSERAGVTKERVIREWARIAFADIRDTIMWRPNVTAVGEDPDSGEPVLRAFNEVEVRASHDLSPDTAAAIKSVSLSANGTLKLEMHDKKGALDSLAKEMGLFKERHELTGPNGGPIEVKTDDHELARRAAFLLRRARPNGQGRAALNGHGGHGPSAMDPEPGPSN